MSRIETKLTSVRTVTTAEQTVPDQIPEGHARLRLAVASLCGTDLHYFSPFANAGFVLQNPVTLGHEACAYVIDPNGSDLEPGQLVALNPIMSCQVCEPSKRGEENLCIEKNSPALPQRFPISTGSSARPSTTRCVAAA